MVSLAVRVQPLALNWPLLTSLNSIIMAMMMVFLTKNSDFRAHKRWLYGLGTSAIIFEVVWIAAGAPSGEPMADKEQLGRSSALRRDARAGCKEHARLHDCSDSPATRPSP